MLILPRVKRLKIRKRKLNVESQLNESANDDLNVKCGNANIIELKGRKGKNSNNLSGIFLS